MTNHEVERGAQHFDIRTPAFDIRHSLPVLAEEERMAATVGLLELKLQVPQAMNLKDKRRALKSFKDRLRNGHNVSVAEVDMQDHIRLAVLAVAMVSNDRRYVEGALQQIVNAAAMHRDMILLEHQVQWL